MHWRRICRKILSIIMAVMTAWFGCFAGGGIQQVYASEVWIEIHNKADLQVIQNDLSAYYRLMADIDLSGDNWTPIGPFTGKLDGNSKVITNLVINDTSTANKGLFSSIGEGGQVSNLGIEAANITAGDYAGILAGTSSGSISRCYVKGNVSGKEYVGGLVGSNQGQVENCFSAAFISGKEYVGGLVGSNSGTVDRSYSSSEMQPSLFNSFLQFDGVNDYITISHRTEYVGEAFTLEAWFQWDETNKSDVDFIIGKGFEQFEIHTGGGSGTNGIRFIPIPHIAADSWLDAKNVIQSGWFHVAAVYEYNAAEQEAKAKVFINGKAQELWQQGASAGTEATLSRTTNTLSGNTYPVDIGRRSDNSFYFKGKICDVRFWNIARTAEQIAADKNKMLTGNETGLVGYWKLDEASGTAANDSTVYDNDGTLMNGITRVQEAAASYMGGLAGQNTGTITDSFYDSEVAGQSDTGKGTPKTTAEMKLQETFDTWDFLEKEDSSGIWGMAPETNNGYPYLLSASKDITAFSFDGMSPVVTGSLDGSTKTISLIVPYGTDVAALAPTIVHTGTGILPTSGAAQNFTSSVAYTVTAEDGSTQDYEVAVTVSPPDFTGGDGSIGDPYQITKLEHLDHMRNYLDKHFILMNDLDYGLDGDYEDIANKTSWTAGQGWVPVGTSSSAFSGSFDGNGHTITGLMINRTEAYTGLFGYIGGGAEVRDIILEDVNITGRAYVGGLSGESDGSVTNAGVLGSVKGSSNVGGLIGKNGGTVSLCYSSAEITVSAAVSENRYYGGLVGYSSSGSTISSSYATGNVTLSHSAGTFRFVGGLVGESNGTVNHSHATGAVTVALFRRYKEYIGGLVGRLAGTAETPAVITNSYATGAVADGRTEGGLVGSATYATISNCYSLGTVTGEYNIGGLAGSLLYSTISNSYSLGDVTGSSPIGGLAGYANNNSAVSNCYSAGSVSGSIYVGGLIGYSDNATITSAYYNSVTSGCSDTGKGTPITTVEMRTVEIFTDWDFDTVWDIVNTQANCSYPYLRNNVQSPEPGYGDKPLIVTQPQNAAVIAGENASFAVAATGTGLSYQWQVDTGTGFGDIADGSVYNGADTAALSITGAEMEMDGYVYRVIVTGTDTLTVTSASAVLAVNLPPAPVIQSVVAGNAHAVINWTSVDGAAGYKIFSSTEPGVYGEPTATVADSVYSYRAEALTNGTTYYFVVRTLIGSHESINSNEVSAMPQVPAPGAPVLKSAVAGDGYVRFSWDSVEGTTGYTVFSSIDPDSYGDLVDPNDLFITVTDSVYSADVINLNNGTTYSFAVKATNPGGESNYSNKVSATPQAPVPSVPLTYTAALSETGTYTFGAATAGYTSVTPHTVTVTRTGTGSITNLTAALIGADAGSFLLGDFGAETLNSITNNTTFTVKPKDGLVVGTYCGTVTVTADNGISLSFDVRFTVNAASNAVTPTIPPSNGDSDRDSKEDPTPAPSQNQNPPPAAGPTKPDTSGVEILINGKAETAATATTTMEEGKTVTTVVIDNEKVEAKLQLEGSKAVVTIPVGGSSDVVVGQLNGQAVKNMELKEAVLEIKTGMATYTLPASQINIDAVSEQIGKQVELKDIEISVKIASSSSDIVKAVEDAASKNNYQIVVKPIEFEITCSSGNKTVEVSRFNAYVERLVAIPEGVDPSRITTGIVLNPDGTFSHVPTAITVIDGKYYAKINSLTNSTYSVIWSPKSFKDVENHWAKEAVNDMASRLVINGVGEDKFEPDRDITRAEFAAIIVRALGLMRPKAGKDTFADVAKGAYYYDAVSIAYEYGIITGYENGKFGPKDKLAREQAMMMFARAMKITGVNAELYKGGKGNITRAEVAVLIRRLLEESKLI